MLVFLTKLVGSPFLTQQLLRRVVLFYGKMKINPHTFRRSHEDMLELQELSLHHDLPNNVMKISFGGSAIVDCQIAETPENIACLVCTSHGASQLMFPHPRVVIK